MEIRRVALIAGVLLPAALCPAQSVRPEDLAPGKILIMQRDAPDPLFAHSVIVLARYDRTGALGLMIHYRSTLTIQQVLSGFKGAEKRADPLFVGGPVELKVVMALLRSRTPPEDASPVAGNLYLLSSKQSIAAALSAGRKASDLRIYLGYAGWGPGQLEREVRLNGWYIFDHDESLVFDEHPETLWQRLIEKTGLLKVLLPRRTWYDFLVAFVDPITRRFLDILASAPGPAPHQMPPAEARAMAVGMSAVFPDTFEAPPAEIEDRVIPGGPNGDLAIRIVRPPDRTGPLPAIMFFHGGGWVLGDFNTHTRLVREIAAGVGAAVVFLEYSRSPEVRFPVANEEAYFATRYIAENGPALNIDPSRIAVAGDSAGANMATVVCMMANARGGPVISSAVLFYPVAGADFETPSFNQFADGYFLSRDAMKWFWDNYLPSAEARRHPHASPVLATAEQLRGHPPAFVMTCECDVLRDQGEAYAARLMDAGVRVAGARYLGAVHACLTLGPLANTPAVRAAIAAANVHLRETLV